MKKVYPIFLLALLFSVSQAFGQALSISEDSVTDATCENNGSLTVSASGGDSSGAGYQYSITNPISQGPQSSGTFNALEPGTYTVEVEDNAGATATVDVTVGGSYTEPTPSVSEEVVDDVCDPYYRLTANVADGLADFTYELIDASDNSVVATSGATSATSHVFDNIDGGDYLVRVTDACGTERTAGITLDELTNEPMTATVGTRLRDCSSTNIEYELEHATFPVEATVTYDDGTSETVTFTSGPNIDIDVNNDIGSIEFTDDCDETVTVQFDLESNPTVVTTTYNENCAYRIILRPRTDAVSNTNFQFVCTNITYCVTNTDTGVETCQNNDPEFIDLPAGDYDLEVTDNCCNETFASTVTLPDLPTPEVLRSNYIRTCNSGTANVRLELRNFSNAELTLVSASTTSFTIQDVNNGGTANINYAVGDVIPQTALNRYDLVNLPIGTYEFEIEDDCNGTTPYTLEITAADVQTYEYEAEYTLGCTDQNSITYGVTQTGGPSWNSSIGYVRLLDSNGDEVSRVATGGFRPDQYRTTNNLSSGDYTVEYYVGSDGGTSVFGTCVMTHTIPITIPPYEIPNLTGTTRYECDGTGTSTIVVDAIGVEPLEYSIAEQGSTDYGPTQSSNVFTGLDPAKEYNVKVGDGCLNSNNNDVTVVSLLNDPDITAEFNCLEGQDDSVRAELEANEINGAVYEWTDSNGTVVSTDRVLSFNPFTDADLDTYTVRVSIPGSNGEDCLEASESFDIPTRECAILVPIKLAEFDAEALDNQVFLSWMSASESNFSHYEVQHAVDGQNFEPIGEVASHSNNTSSASNYEFVHTQPQQGANYYRLRMVDLDESFNYSWIEIETFAGEIVSQVSLWPNPVVDGSISISYVNPIESLKVVNPQGQVLTHLTEIGERYYTLNTQNLAPGIYVLVVNGQDQQKFIVGR